jgi:hypothetical protein
MKFIYIVFVLFVSGCSTNSTQERQESKLDAADMQDRFKELIYPYKNRIFNIYKRSLQVTDAFEGDIVFEFKISPSGKINDCRKTKGEISNEKFEALIIKYICSIDFGTNNGIDGNVVIEFPLRFIP